MWKYLFCLCALLVVGCSSVPSLEDKPVGDDGILFFSTAGEWDYGGVYISGEHRGWLRQSQAAIRLAPGQYALTMFERHSGYQGKYVSTLSMHIPFTIKAGQVTSLGKLAIFRQGGKQAIVALEDKKTGQWYLEQYYPKLYGSLAEQDFGFADIKFSPAESLTGLRQAFARAHSIKLKRQGDLEFGELGIIAKKEGSTRHFVDTETLATLLPAEQHSSVDEHYFLDNFGQLFCYCDEEVVPVGHAEGQYVSALAVSRNMMLAADGVGGLKTSKDRGESWSAVPVLLSEVYMIPHFSFYQDQLFVGPLTRDYRAADANPKGVVFDVNTAEFDTIGWSEYVTEKTRFYNVGGDYVFDPVNLNKKQTFLFRYNGKDNDWDEVKLPNRHCDIAVEQDVIKLNCRQGSDFVSPDAGRSWQEVLEN
ncbi:hypothetical protein [Gilvimarinus polysaccharolyticus]|uniref:hypothetical protein n=1 Tax=Gilvimarinus polysaccharolyticus TaxID=863921 RepID=UPI0012F7CDCF|nr:hypothetical protein [Gilvimarinus polysaccharolyticus]